MTPFILSLDRTSNPQLKKIGHTIVHNIASYNNNTERQVVKLTGLDIKIFHIIERITIYIPYDLAWSCFKLSKVRRQLYNGDIEMKNANFLIDLCFPQACQWPLMLYLSQKQPHTARPLSCKAMMAFLRRVSYF